MKKVLIIVFFINLVFSNILDREFYMEYIIQVNQAEKGVLRVKNTKNKANVKYINIDKNDNLPFFYDKKQFTYQKNKAELKSKIITIDKKYQVVYFVSKEDADEYNIAEIDRNDMSAIKNLDADEVIATFHKNPLNTFEGLILYFMNNKKVNKKQRMWIYEPQKNILFHLGVLKESKNHIIKINNNTFKTNKLIIGRISFDDTKKIPLFEIYTYKDLVLRIKSTSDKYELNLNGIGQYKKGKFSLTNAISQRTLKRLEKNHNIPINVIDPKKEYKNGKFIITTELFIPKNIIADKGKDSLFQYLQNTDRTDLKNKNKFKYVTTKEICSYIHILYPNKYTKDCKYKNIKKQASYDINDINNALTGKRYKKCYIKDDDNLLKTYRKKLICEDKYENKEEAISMNNIGEIIIKNLPSNIKNYYTHQSSSSQVKNNLFFIKTNYIEHKKIDYNLLMKKNASRVIKLKYFDKKAKEGKIKFVKKGNKYGFSINEKKFHLYVCNTKTNLKKKFLYNKGGCYIKNYTEYFNKQNEKVFLSNKLNENKPILKLIKRDKKEKNGEVYFEELQGKAFNNFKF